MLFEQAFMALPEFLTGTPFQRYQFEGTVVTAFSMAVLQELNSRNVANPISLLRAEVEYPVDESRRADLHIDLHGLNVMSAPLQSYGYYENNWLEAKFCRLGGNGMPVVSPLTSTFLLLKDLIRLCSLVPDSLVPGEKSHCGRYLLHAYQNSPERYLVYSRNQHGKRAERTWINKVLTAGQQELVVADLELETTSTFASYVGRKAGLIKLRAGLCNLVHRPNPTSDAAYYIVLTRIEDFTITVGRRWFRRERGVVTESANGFGLLLPRLVNHLLAG
jgi:hypothetical protein